MKSVDPLPGKDDVVVWFAPVTEAAINAARELLAQDEQDRVARLKVERARGEFILGRGLLRAVAGAALSIPPEQVAFTVGEQGKLAVEGLQLNVSHSFRLVAIALARIACVGVDVEWRDRSIEARDIARANFAVTEVAEIEAAAPGRTTATFFDIWTKKEAVLKAHGRGLGLGLSTFAVSAAAAEQTVTVDGRSFHVHRLAAPERYAAALAIEGSPLPLRVVTLDDDALLALLRRA